MTIQEAQTKSAAVLAATTTQQQLELSLQLNALLLAALLDCAAAHPVPPSTPGND